MTTRATREQILQAYGVLHQLHDGDLILFSVEDYQPFEPESCLDEYFLFCNITVNGKPTDRDDLTSGQYSDMVATTNEGTYYAHY